METNGKIRCFNGECEEILNEKVIRYTSDGRELYFCSDGCGSVFAAMNRANLYRENPSDESLERRI